MSAVPAVTAPTDAAQFVGQFHRAMERLTTVAGEELLHAVRDLPRFENLLRLLLGEDAEYQRAFRRSVVIALTHVPRGLSMKVPARMGLQVLHACLMQHGPVQALEALTAAEVPTWTQLIRLYRPDYAMGSVSARGSAEVKRLIAAIEAGEEVDLSGLQREQQAAVCASCAGGRPIVARREKGVRGGRAGAKRRAPKVFVRQVRTPDDLRDWVTELRARRDQLNAMIGEAMTIHGRAVNEELTEIPVEWMDMLSTKYDFLFRVFS